MQHNFFLTPALLSRAEKCGEIQIHNIILKFPALDFFIWKIKEWEIKNSFCCSLPYFSIYPITN